MHGIDHPDTSDQGVRMLRQGGVPCTPDALIGKPWINQNPRKSGACHDFYVASNAYRALAARTR